MDISGNRFAVIWMYLAFSVQSTLMSQNVTIMPFTADKIEQSTVNLTCIYKGNDTWLRWTHKVSNICLYKTGTCSTIMQVPGDEKDKYTCTCLRTLHNETHLTLQLFNITKEYHNTTWICTVYQPTLYHTNASLFVKVPVKTVDITSPSDSHITLEEHKIYQFRCKTSYSRPTPTVNWFLISAGNTFQINATNRNILTLDDKTFISVTNVLNISFSREENRAELVCKGNNSEGKEITSRKIKLNISYPADVGSLKKTSIKEFSTLNITCPVIPENPSTTVIFWTRESDIKRWNSRQLIISNVTRADDTFYTCTVLSEMVPTVGNITQTVRSSNFHLNVLYSAIVKTFSLVGKESKENFVVNQTEQVSFICTVEANPVSDTAIMSPNREEIIMQSQKNNVSQTLQNTSCENAGEYICNGRNNYTIGEESSSKLILIVRCPPRPSSGNTNDEKIATAQYVDVILQFTARNYLDLPDQTKFMWFKDNVSLESDNRSFGISSNGLQSNLYIKNITQSQFGQYDVRVSNTVGQYIHVYNVMAKDKPEAPKDFANIDDSITDSSVTMRWIPGFDRGYPQTFNVLYKGSTEQFWNNKTITDKGKSPMTYTLFGLFSEMEYQVNMFARNEVGDSAYTEILQFRTKAPVETAVESQTSSMVDVVAGSVSTCIAIVAVIIVVFVYRKRLKQIDTRVQNVRERTRTTTDTESLTYHDLDVSKREGNTYSQLHAAYEQLDNVTTEGSTYMEMENTNVKREDPDYINTRI